MPVAARFGDAHTCPVHGGGPVTVPLSPDVIVNFLRVGRATDQALCVPPMDFIVTGASTVIVNYLLVARLSDHTMHGGVITSGSGDVIIGGPTAGVSLGFSGVWQAVFDQAASSRTSQSDSQSYQNCGVESARQILLAAGIVMSEDALLDWAIQQGFAADSTNPADRGGTSPDGRQSILDEQGVPSHQDAATRENLAQAVAEGRGVVSSHDAGALWGNTDYNGSGHAVMVTGVQYDANGNASHVIINDTGTGVGSVAVPADQYFESLRSGRDLNVTDEPIIQ